MCLGHHGEYHTGGRGSFEIKYLLEISYEVKRVKQLVMEGTSFL